VRKRQFRQNTIFLYKNYQARTQNALKHRFYCMETLARSHIPALKRKFQTQCFPLLQKVLIHLPFVFIIPKILFLTEVSCFEFVLNTDLKKKKLFSQYYQPIQNFLGTLTDVVQNTSALQHMEHFFLTCSKHQPTLL